MKQLAMMRHAKSDWGHPGLTDFDRPLNKRGRKAARAIGKELRHREIAFDQVVSSPAQRAKESVERLTDGLEYEPHVRFEPQMYLPTTETLTKVIQALPDEAKTVMIVGHNPGFHDLVLRLTKDDDDGHRERICGNFPTAAFSLISFPVERWGDIRPATGEIRELILPREL